MKRFLAPLASAFALFCPMLAHAADGYATPPGDFPSRLDDPPSTPDDPPSRSDDPPTRPDDFEPEASALRLSTGPVLRATTERADGGFSAAIDLGARAAGARIAGSWVRTGSDRGLSQYDAQLWIDFGADQRLHPILAAGAGLARLEHADALGALHANTVGIGSLRGTLEYCTADPRGQCARRARHRGRAARDPRSKRAGHRRLGPAHGARGHRVLTRQRQCRRENADQYETEAQLHQSRQIAAGACSGAGSAIPA
jgi:hypothetical protein